MNNAPHILIIDDNQGIHRDFSLAFLNESENSELAANEERVFGKAQPVAPKLGYEIEHALNGMEGIEKVKQALAANHPFQMAFVDIRMPGIDGVETVERIWEIDPALQVVFCTAYSDYSWDDLARRLGQTDKALVLKKPFDYLEVIQMASTLTEKWFLARQAELKLEQMELLVSQRTQKLLELQRSESERIRELDQMKLRLFSNISEELRPPVNLILESLVAGKADKQPEQMRRNAEQLLQLVNRMSEIRRLETGDLKLNVAQADLVGESAESISPEPQTVELPLILVVEGNPDLGLYISQSLGAHYRVVEATGAEKGLEKAREIVPDLVIACTGIRPFDGFELCRRLKEDELASHIPVILVGAEGMETERPKALEAGAGDYLAKPFNPPLLRLCVDQLLQSSRKPEGALKNNLQPRDIAANRVDARFLRHTTEIVEAHMADFEFDVENLAQKMFMSRRQLLRKLKGVAGCSPNAFIRVLRLKRAAQLLKTSGMTVSEVTYAVGFSDLKHFRTVFREQFGVSPAEYGRGTE